MNRVTSVSRTSRGLRAFSISAALMASGFGAHAQPEIAGGSPAATGGPVPSNISVPQEKSVQK